MNYKLGLIVICTVICLLTINVAVASEAYDSEVLNNDINDNNLNVTNNDINDDLIQISEDNSLSQDSKLFTDLNEDINGNQDIEVNLSSDYTYNYAYDSSFSQGISISRDVTINGNGHTIDGDSKARIFQVTDDGITVVLKNIIFKNGFTANNGGAILGYCLVQNCTFIKNTAKDCGGAIYGGSAVNCNFTDNVAQKEGGAIYVCSDYVLIENCTFHHNLGYWAGGAISIDAATNTTITNCIFNLNAAKTAGAISAGYSKRVYLSDSNFTGNTATDSAGAINYDFAIDNIIVNCYFENNRAVSQNGGAFTWIYSNGFIFNNVFRRNSAGGNGGAIYIDMKNIGPLFNQLLSDCSFEDNHGKNGGAIYNNGQYNMTGSGLNFINNLADENGGAIYCLDHCYISDFNFTGNSAHKNGGAIYCRDYGSFGGLIFINNSADENGGAVYSGNHGDFYNNKYISNSAQTAGAVYCNDENYFINIIFTNNSAYDAGALYSGDGGDFYNLKFYNNTASNYAGAVYCCQSCTFDYITFINNSASSGAAIYTVDTFNVIRNSIFLLNKADPNLDVKNEYLTLTLTLSGYNTYLNAFYSWFGVDFENVTYWNGTITNTDIMPPVERSCPGQNFTIEIYDSNNNQVKKFNKQTDVNGQIILDYIFLDAGNYVCKIYNEDNDYYTGYSTSLNLTVGDFAKLQRIFYFASDNSIINLTQNYTYSIGLDTINTLYVDHENLSINGNGYTINALNKTVELFASDSNLSIFNCSFVNGAVIRCMDMKNVSIIDCYFENSTDSSITCTRLDACQIINCNFVDNYNYYYNGGAFYGDEIGFLMVKDCNFTNNSANYGGAVYSRNNDEAIFEGCIFSNNVAQSSDGAVGVRNITDVNFVNCSFFNNLAEKEGGALGGNIITDVNFVNCSFFNNSAVEGGAVYCLHLFGDFTFDYCVFINNSVSSEGSAIYFCDDNLAIRNSIFLNNKASSKEISVVEVTPDLHILINFKGGNNFINAIYSLSPVSCENVTYWDGAITNTDMSPPILGRNPGVNITIEAYDSYNNLIKNVTEKTNNQGQLIYDLLDLPSQSSQLVIYHGDDDYYAESASYTHSSPLPSGDFTILQYLIDNAAENSVINLRKDFTYSPDLDTKDVIEINHENITINGNGHVINGLNQSGIFKINSNVILNNITLTGTGNTKTTLLISMVSNCEINNCNFINNNVGRGNGLIYVAANNLTINNCNFINSTGIPIILLACKNIMVYNSTFINNTRAIFSAGMDNISIDRCNFINNSNSNFGTVDLKAKAVIIENSNFTANRGYVGGAINTANLDGSILYVSNCIFTDNSAVDRAGAICTRTDTFNLFDSTFIGNTANNSGGAIYSGASNANIIGCRFFNNSATEGSAIYWSETNILKNSIFLDNKAYSHSLSVESIDKYIIIKFLGKNSYINAIYSPFPFEIQNVTYWNGDVVNSDDVTPIGDSCPGQNITLEIYDDKENLLENITLVSDGEGKIYYVPITLDDGNYSFKAYHLDDEYYTYIGGCNGTFKLNRYPSHVDIDISNGTEIYYSPNCNISFNIVNRTVVRVVITNIDGSQVYINQTVDEDYVIVNLDPSEVYYNITVYNYHNMNYAGSHDSKLFKIIKANSSIIINQIPDVDYNNVFNVTYDGENLTTVNVTVFDANNIVVFNKTVAGKLVTIPVLPAGTYNITVINNGNEYYCKSADSKLFNILKAYNFAFVIVDDVVYGNEAIINIVANVDGVYAVDVNGTQRNVNVVGGIGNVSLRLDVGSYYANATFNNSNYDTIVINDSFDVLPTSDYEMTIEPLYGEDVNIIVKLPHDAEGTATVNVNDRSYTSIVNDGTAIIVIPDLESKDYNLTVIYSGDKHYSSKSMNVLIHVKKVMIDAYDAQYGWAQSINYSIKLIDEYGNGVPNKEVLFSINGKSFKATTNEFGIASVGLSLEIGSYDIKISYLSQSITKNIKVVSRFSGNKNINMYYFDGTKYSVKVYGNDGKLVGANEKVVIKLNKKTYTVKTNKNGIAILTIPKTVKIGKYTITATYNGQTVKNTIKVKQILTSKKLVKVKKTAKKLILKVKLKKKLKGKKITFKFRGKKYVAKTKKNGIAKVTIKKNIIKKLKRGKKYKVIITYFKASLKTYVKVR